MWNETARGEHRFILHAGGEEVKREALKEVSLPEATKTYNPVGHWEYYNHVVSTLQDLGYTVAEERHALAKEGQRYFGMLFVPGPDKRNRDFEWAIGLRNSFDKSVACRMALGTRVFVCDNLAFSGEINVVRKHTSRVHDHLPGLIQETVGKLRQHMIKDDARRLLYERKEVNDSTAHDLMVRALRMGVVPATLLPDVVEEWHKPEQEEFQPRNMWSLFNAFTHNKTVRSPDAAVKRGHRLHALFDGQFEDVDFENAMAQVSDA